MGPTDVRSGRRGSNSRHSAWKIHAKGATGFHSQIPAEVLKPCVTTLMLELAGTCGIRRPHEGYAIECLLLTRIHAAPPLDQDPLGAAARRNGDIAERLGGVFIRSCHVRAGRGQLVAIDVHRPSAHWSRPSSTPSTPSCNKRSLDARCRAAHRPSGSRTECFIPWA